MDSDGALVDCCGQKLTCRSERAVELYDKALTAVISSNGGCLTELKNAVEADERFVMAHCFLACMWAGEFKTPSDPELAPHLSALQVLIDDEEVTNREKEHIKAALAFSKGSLPQACIHWSNIIIKYPLDGHAIKWMFEAGITLGEYEKMRDVLSSVIVHWSSSMTLYPYILAFYGFSLEETNQRDRAEEVCMKALQLQPNTPWSIHAMSHVVEEARDASMGVEFITSRRQQWVGSNLGNHISWHLCLHYLDLGETEKLFEEYDSTMEKNVLPGNLFPLLDASSLLWRLQMRGIDPGDRRWQKLVDAVSPQIGKPTMTWYTCHLMMALSHGKLCESTARLALARQMIKSVEEYAESEISTDCDIATLLGVPVCNALLAYGEERYSEVISLLLPLRYDIIRLGGSWAQRQVFSVTLIQAAINAHQLPLALSLIASLKDQKPHSKTLQKLFDQVKTNMKQTEEDNDANSPPSKKRK